MAWLEINPRQKSEQQKVAFLAVSEAFRQSQGSPMLNLKTDS